MPISFLWFKAWHAPAGRCRAASAPSTPAIGPDSPSTSPEPCSPASAATFAQVGIELDRDLGEAPDMAARPAFMHTA
jgi:hypothetical protein